MSRHQSNGSEDLHLHWHEGQQPATPEPPQCVGRFVPLRTKAEAQVKLELIDAYIVEVPVKFANSILKAVDEAIPRNEDVNIQHLRRFAKLEVLPGHLRDQFQNPGIESNAAAGLSALPTNSASAADAQTNAVSPDNSDAELTPSTPTIFLLISPTTSIPLPTLLILLTHCLPFIPPSLSPTIHTISIPLHAPTTEVQALQWSKTYWPTVYKKHNPHGPHPSIVARAEEGLRPWTGQWMALARHVGMEAGRAGIGEGIGVVIIDPSAEGAGKPRAIAAAGDARWKKVGMEARIAAEPEKPPIRTRTDHDNGNAIAHATLRAIGMVARKRLEAAATFPSSSPLSATASPSPAPSNNSNPNPSDDVFLDTPLTPTENSVYAALPIKPGGYLCTELEIYLTHEPCVMCCMAILHSRFRSVIFRERMCRTGGLVVDEGDRGGAAARKREGKGRGEEEGEGEGDEDGGDRGEAGLGYGLWWRPELNWRLLAWQWVDGKGDANDEARDEKPVGQNVHA